MPDFSKVTALLPDLADYLVYAAIAVVTLIGVIKCLAPLWNTTHALRRAIHRLQAAAGTQRETPVWQEPRFMGKRLKGSWLRFLQNAEQLDRRGLPCNVEDYINDDTVTNGPGNAQLAELIPSLLTSLGILGTFMGLMRGLSGLDFSDAAQLIAGIPTLLTGMKFAFGTSVAGISCSLSFNMLNRIAQGSSFRAIDDFVESFTTLAMHRPLDNDVQLICQNQDRNHMLSSATDGLATQMAGCIELAVTRAMQPVSQSMDNFIVGATRAQVDGVGRIVNSFVQQMNTSLGDQLLALGQTMTAINQHQQVTFDRVEQSLGTASTIVEDVGKLHGVSQEVITHFEKYISELSDARHRDEKFEQSTAELMDKLHGASAEQSAFIGKLREEQDALREAMERFDKTSAETLSGVRGGMTAASRDLSEAGQSVKQSGEALAASYQNFLDNVVEGLSHSMGMFDQSMQTMLSTLGRQMDAVKNAATGSEVSAQLGAMQRMMADMQDTLTRAADSLERSGSGEG